MRRRSFFGRLLALVTAPFVAKAVAPISLDEQFSVDMDWSQFPNPYYLSPAIDPFPFKPFCEFDAPIESMRTGTTDGEDTVLLVVAGGINYFVDRHGVVTRL